MLELNNKKAITLVALIITIIVLLILAGITINILLGENGILRNAEIAKEKYENKAEKEEILLSETSEYLTNYRGNIGIAKSIINKNDGIYNVSEQGYIFNTPYNTAPAQYTSNNVIRLSESIEEYNYITIEFDSYSVETKGYVLVANLPFFSVQTIKEKYSNVQDAKKTFSIVNTVGSWWNRICFYFVNSNTIVFQSGISSESDISKIRIIDIKGIK